MADVGPNESSMDTYELDNVSLTDPPQSQKKCKKKKHKTRRRGQEEQVQEKAAREGQRLTRGASTAPPRQRS